MRTKQVVPSRELLLRVLNEGYEKKAWHGPNLRGAIRGLNAREAAWRPAPGRHNIWEIVLHTAYWKYAVRRRLLGEKRGAFPFKGSNWFKRPLELSEKAWREDIALLAQQHRRLCEAVARATPAALRKIPRGTQWTGLEQVLGVAHHDIYHAGQIQLLKRLQKKPH